MAVQTTIGGFMKTEFKWIFRDFTLNWASKKPGEYFLSSHFHAEGDEEVKWCLKIYPHGQSDDEKQISFYLQLEKSPGSRKEISGRFWFAIYDESQTNRKKRQLFVEDEDRNEEFVFTRGEPGFGIEYPGNQAEFLKCNHLAVICKLEYSHPKTSSTIVTTRSLSSSTISREEQDSTWSGDLERLLTSETGSDICFIINDQEIRAHKSILLARSPVFAAMLNCEMKENVTSRVDIQDISPDIFQALLRFIYTDRVDLTKTDAKGLLIAANKYLIPLLKFRCQESLSKSLTVENCSEMLVLADVCNAVHLRKSTTEFIQFHRKEIMKTESWKGLKESRLDLAVQVLESLL